MHQGLTLGLDVVPWVPLTKHILTSLAFSAFLAPTVSQYFSLHISSYFLLVSREGIYLSALGLIVRSHVNLLSLSLERKPRPHPLSYENVTSTHQRGNTHCVAVDWP